jgi:uncharacterized delta-60 repeat protein
VNYVSSTRLVKNATAATLCVASLLAARPAVAAPGDADGRFSQDGFAFSASAGDEFAVRASDVAVDSQGRPVVVLRVADCSGPGAGIECLGSYLPGLARFLPDGAHDPTLGGDGELEPRALPRTGDWEGVRVMDLATDGDAIVLSGAAGGPPKFWVARLLADGSPDPAFGGGDGAITFNSFGTSVHEQSEANSIVVDAQGRITVVGRAETDSGDNPTMVVARILEDGTFDPSFSVDGWLTEATGDDGVYQTIGVALGPSGRIVAGARPFGSRQELFAYTADGLRDVTFSLDGVVELPVSAVETESDRFVIDPAGRILAAGRTAQDQPPQLVRLAPDGTVDATFGAGGIVPMVFPTAHSTDRGGTDLLLAVDDESRPVVGLGPAITVARFTEGGSLDTSFSGDGASSVYSRAGVASATDMTVGSDAVVLAGNAGPNALQARAMVNARRLDPGPLDTDADLLVDDLDPCPYIYGECPKLKRRFSHLRFTRFHGHPQMFTRIRTRDFACDEGTITLYRTRPGRDRVIETQRSTPQFFLTGRLQPGRYYARAQADRFDFGYCAAIRSETELVASPRRTGR